MTASRPLRRLLLPLLLAAAWPCTALAQPAAPPPAASAAVPDGQRDFDWELGTWKTHVKRRLRPLSGSDEWVEYEGTSRVRQVWDGRANLLELDVRGPAGRIEALSLRLYNPATRQWSLNFASSAGGTLGVPSVGTFSNGRGEFFADETFDGKQVRVRFVMHDITPTSARFEQAFSADGGKTWEVNWVAVDRR
jgi:hypothetical protein